eukprot:1391078-Amorphochlora_amoeboformis.AAC.1
MDWILDSDTRVLTDEERLEKIAKSMVIARGNKGLRHVGFFNIAENICRGRRSYTAYVYPWGEQDRHDSWESSNWYSISGSFVVDRIVVPERHEWCKGCDGKMVILEI